MRTIMTVIVAGLAIAGCSNSPKQTDHASADPWSTVGVGTVFETTTVTRLERPFVHQSETTTRQTLIAKSDAEVSIKLEVTSAGRVSAQDIKVLLRHDEAEACTATTVTTTADETCTVPAGTFECTRTTREVREGNVTRSTMTWTAKNVPVPIKSVVTNENMTTTTELTRLARR